MSARELPACQTIVLPVFRAGLDSYLTKWTVSSCKLATFCHSKFGQRPEDHHIPEYLTVWTICKKMCVLFYSLGKNT